MKRLLIISSVLVALMLGNVGRTLAQGDDVYYDPSKDNSYQNTQQYDPNSQQQGDDGYGNPAYKYDGKDNSYTNSGILDDDGYYSDDDDYLYTSRVRRFYTPNYGVDYYSYWFTPSYYLGWNTWNGGMVVSASPWYRDPWWGWNRGYRSTVVVVDPFYDPYWSYNWGWNSYSYLSSWNYGYGGYYGRCSYYGLGLSFGYGYNPWSYGYGYGGYGAYGGCYGGYNTGYYGYGGGYYGGGYYNNGYYKGYYDGYHASNNSRYYYSPKHRVAIPQNGLSASNPRGGSVRGAMNNNGSFAPGRNPGLNDMRNTDIPREGLTRPNPGVRGATQPDNSVRSNEPSGRGSNINTNRNEPTRGGIQEQNWKSEPPARWNGGANNNNNNSQQQPAGRGSFNRQEPSQQFNNQPQRYEPQQRGVQQPPQQRMEPQRSVPQQQYQQPQQRMEPQRNFEPQQRNYSPAPQQRMEPQRSAPSPRSQNFGGFNGGGGNSPSFRGGGGSSPSFHSGGTGGGSRSFSGGGGRAAGGRR